MRRTATSVLLLLAIIIALHVWRQGGTYAARSWIKAKFLNDPLPRPTRGARAA